jgi:hypothetical protein
MGLIIFPNGCEFAEIFSCSQNTNVSAFVTAIKAKVQQKIAIDDFAYHMTVK